ncbi:hypothetical protein KM427_10870 [Nocardioides sp. LMS-CY]|uniref:hypothetical protein n=1 Tax=Nocardioides sp. (strain LMS-CY) TaxID=2840457 RepID=UPI001C004FEB|nr:hypothetical protein [Nocardioides sp. LMS-CY]QWF24142.1 hypothetical protein KM427_10870 [Nocardioides sp. LMS-CY]
MVLGAQSSRADEWYPGLPDPDGTTGSSWGGASQGGISYAKRAKQWFRSPDGMVTFTAALIYEPREPDSWSYGAFGEAYIVSPNGAPENYGYMAPITVRSVGFGLMPVEATVQISQRRENGYPIPLTTTLRGTDYYEPGIQDPVRQVASETVVEDAFNIQILQVRVDGVDLDLSGDCRTVTPAPMRVVGPSYTIPFPRSYLDESGRADIKLWFRSQDPSTFFSPLYGGELTGTITIPPFTGCTTASGDDLSKLMTLSVSGPDNPVSARVGWPCVVPKEGTEWPLAPGQATPGSTIEDAHPTSTGNDGLQDVRGCNGTKKFVYPERTGD